MRSKLALAILSPSLVEHNNLAHRFTFIKRVHGLIDIFKLDLGGHQLLDGQLSLAPELLVLGYIPGGDSRAKVAANDGPCLSREGERTND